MLSPDPQKATSPHTHRSDFTPEEVATIHAKLQCPIPPEGIAYRSSSGQGGSVAYVEGWRAFNYANEIFGFNGWSSEILNFTTDFIDTEGGKFSVGVSCTVRITLKDGAFHEDIGYGTAENVRSKGAALDKARKEAVTDAIKRALRLFGNHLGNCCYDKDYLRAVKNAPKQPYKMPVQAAAPISHAAPVINRVKEEKPHDIIMTEEDLIMGSEMTDISHEAAPRQVAQQHRPPSVPFQPLSHQLQQQKQLEPQQMQQQPSIRPQNIPVLASTIRTSASPSRMTTFQPPSWNHNQQQPMRQPDFQPFNPQGQASIPAAQPPNEFVKWNPSNLNQR